MRETDKMIGTQTERNGRRAQNAGIIVFDAVFQLGSIHRDHDYVVPHFTQNGPQLLPGYEYELTPGGIAREPVNRSFPAASEALLLEAFRAGTPLRVVRPRNVQIPCGMCDGTGKIPVERIVIDGVAGERIITGTCPRCDGSGKRDEQVEALYTIRFTTAGT